MIRCTVLFSAVVLLAHAQSTAPAFDVASVKPTANCEPGMGGRIGLSPRNLSLPCMPLRTLLQLAYGEVLTAGGLGAKLLEVEGGPPWMDTERFDVMAKSGGDAVSAAPMLRTLLEDRFKVRVHKEAKESPVYILSVASGGPKLQATKEGSCVQMDLTDIQRQMPNPGEARPVYCGMGSMKSGPSGQIADWKGTSTAELAGRMLTGMLELPVVDQTGLTGHYDIHLEFVRERPMGNVTLNGQAMPNIPPAALDPTPGTSIFTALEKQLGLKLSKGKAPLDVIIVDHAEKPTAN